VVGWGRVGGTPSHTQTPKKTYTKLQIKRIEHRENKRLVVLASVAAIHRDLGLAIYYLYKAKNIVINGIVYADLEHVYVLKNNALIKIPTKEFRTELYE
jgi:hypothetical protein